eukprot:g7312.t1
MFADKADLVRGVGKVVDGDEKDGFRVEYVFGGVHCYAIILPYFLQDESKSKAKFGQVIFEDGSLWKAPVVEEKFTKISLAANDIVQRKTFCVLRLTLSSSLEVKLSSTKRSYKWLTFFDVCTAPTVLHN